MRMRCRFAWKAMLCVQLAALARTCPRHGRNPSCRKRSRPPAATGRSSSASGGSSRSPTDGKVNPLRGGKPTGYIFYTASGEMGAMIQPERAADRDGRQGAEPAGGAGGAQGLHRLFRHLHHRREGQDRHPSPQGQRAARLRGGRAAPLPVRAATIGWCSAMPATTRARWCGSADRSEMDVLMPQLGETVAEGKITKWFKSAGDAVKPGDNLFEIETDKVSMEVPSTIAGTLAEIRVGVGEVAPVGAVVAVIAGDGAAAQHGGRRLLTSSASQSAGVSYPVAPHRQLRSRASRRLRVSGATPAAPARSVLRGAHARAQFRARPLPGGTFVTPLARRLASEAGIDLGRITPSGPHGRIVARDVEAACRHAAAAAPRRRAAPSAAEVMALYRDVPFEEMPLDGMRKTIATRLVQAKQTIPHFYLTADVEIGRLLALREDANAAAPKDKDGDAGLSAFGQRSRHQDVGGGAATRAGRQRSMGGRPHPALQAFRHRHRGRDRGRADHAGDPAGRAEIAHRNFRRDARARRARADAQAQAERIPGRIVGDLEPRHVRRARVRGDHQSAACDHPRGRRVAPAGGREGRRLASASPA